MAPRKKLCLDYRQFNSFSSVVLYDTTTSKNSGKLYDVERIISRRKCKHDYEYLIKWKDWSLDSCSWEPSSNLTSLLLKYYDNPPIEGTRLQVASGRFESTILSMLRSPSVSPTYTLIELDIWRYITYKKGSEAEHKGHFLFQKNDFERLKYLSSHWWYYLDEHGEGVSIDFPLKVKPVLSWSAATYYKSVSGSLQKSSRLPVEKICISMARKACNIENTVV